MVILLMQPCIERGRLSLQKMASGTVKSFLVSYGVKYGFSGLLVTAEPGKMRTIAQKIGRLVLRMLCCVVAGGFWGHACLKSTST